MLAEPLVYIYSQATEETKNTSNTLQQIWTLF